jgi:hypothetical protein
MDGTGVLERELVVGFILFLGVLLAWWMDGWMDGWGIKQTDFFSFVFQPRDACTQRRERRGSFLMMVSFSTLLAPPFLIGGYCGEREGGRKWWIFDGLI